jgi:HEAT repeat protein
MKSRLLLIAVLATGLARAADYNLADVLAYDFDKPRAPLAAVEDAARLTDPAKRAAVEKDMLTVLADAKASYAAKQFACRTLRLIGGEACVEPVAALLTDEKLSHMARYALQSNPSLKVDEVFRAALAKTSGDLQIGVINSIGMRADAKAVEPLAKLAANSEAAILALGRIGTPAAAEALLALKPQGALASAWGIAVVNAGERLVAQKEKKSAQKLLRAAYAAAQQPVAKMAALRGLIAVDSDAAADLPALLKDKDPAVAVAAAQLLAEQPGKKISKVIAAQLPGATPTVQVILLRNLAGRGDDVALPAVVQLASGASAEVATAAATTLGEIGGADQAALLLKLAAAGGDTGAAAVASLEKLRGKDVNAALLKSVGDAEASIRVAALNALAARDAKEAAAALLAAGKDTDAKAKSAAFKALRVLAGPSEVKPLLEMLTGSASGADRQRIQPALAAAVERSTDAAAVAALLTGALNSANDEIKQDLLPVFGRLSGAQALAAVQGQLKGANVETRKAAIRALADWRDAAPLNDLLAAAKGDADDNAKILALRGYIQLAGLPSQRPAAESLALYKNAMELAARPEEKMLVLAGLAGVKSADAFKLAATCLGENKKLNEAAANTLAQLAGMLSDKHDAEAAVALKQIQPLVKDKKLKAAVEAALKKVAPPKEAKKK